MTVAFLIRLHTKRIKDCSSIGQKSHMGQASGSMGSRAYLEFEQTARTAVYRSSEVQRGQKALIGFVLRLLHISAGFIQSGRVFSHGPY